MRLQGKVAVITGAGSGIGRAMTILFASEGAKVVAGEWHEETLSEVVSTVRDAGGTITGVRCNVAVREQAEGLVNTAIEAYGRVDIVCNNAGVMDSEQGVGELTDDIWQRVMSINVDGPMFTSRKAVPLMVAQGSGVIINIISVGGLSGAAAGAAYTTSKHALVGLTKNTAWLYGQKGVRCVGIAPGGVKTNIMSQEDMAHIDPTGAQRFGAYQALMPAMLEPIDIANAALFLASDEARQINGVVLPVDAGWLSA